MKNLKIRRRLIRSMRNRISYSVTVAVTPETFQNDVIFHFFPEQLTGGFAGVDVFFVISGFLMTSLISRDLRSNSLSLTRFYVARANRIALRTASGVFLS